MLAPGKAARLGHYVLDEKIGEGGMGIVYRAHDEKLGREVAIKVLHPHLLKHENLKERFRREARMHAKLIHPNIVTLLALYEDDEHMALVMEMVHGVNLRQYMREHPRMDLLDIIRISEAVLAGLDAAHKMGIVHRDLKPANVLLSEDGGVKLMDFGLAKPTGGDEDLTQSGATVGSFRYMAPEQILNQPVDARTDLYSFGILLYQMCTGKLPFDATGNGAGEFEIMEKQIRQDPVPPIKLNPGLPKMMSNLILDLLAKNPSDRPPNCETVHKMLMQVAASIRGDLGKHADATREVVLPPPSERMSNLEIAKGLVRALLHRLGFRRKPPELVSKKGLPARSRRTWRTPAVWGVAFLLLLGVGLGLWSVLHMAESQRQGATATGPVAGKESSKEAGPEASKPEEAKPVAAAKTAGKPASKAPTASSGTAKSARAAKAPKAQSPRKVRVRSARKHTTRSRPVVRPVTDRVGHKLVRSDGTHAGIRERHEFRGGSRLYFESLRNYRWKDKFRTYKKAQLRLFLDRPVEVRRVVIHKASVGKADFTGGEIELQLQDARGKWHQILKLNDRDIDRPLSISVRRMGKVKGARFRFRSPEPITVGPIDLLP